MGSALQERFSVQETHALSHGDLDITRPGDVRDAITRIRPDVIFNCAVTGVDDCERDPSLARAVNVGAPASLAAAAHEIDATFVHFSSNYVFDGNRDHGTYTVDDEPRPINVYGRTKLDGEHAAAERCQRTFIIRTSWVYGRGKNSFLATAAQKLRRGERIRVISDTWASSTNVSDLATRLMSVLEGGVYGTYQIVNDGVCSYETFAYEAARLASVPDEVARRLIEVTTELEMGREARRPRYTPMRCLLSERQGFPPLRGWQNALQEYVAEVI